MYQSQKIEMDYSDFVHASGTFKFGQKPIEREMNSGLSSAGPSEKHDNIAMKWASSVNPNFVNNSLPLSSKNAKR